MIDAVAAAAAAVGVVVVAVEFKIVCKLEVETSFANYLRNKKNILIIQNIYDKN